jgi:hypothetical protein
MAGELAEYEGTVAAATQLGHEVEESLCLARWNVKLGVDEARMTGGLA